MGTTLQPLIAALLKLLIDWLGSLIPWIGKLATAPVIGWIFDIALSYLSGKLADLIALWAKYREINIQTEKEVADAHAATIALNQVQNDPNATGDQRAEALKNFHIAVAALTHFKVQ